MSHQTPIAAVVTSGVSHRGLGQDSRSAFALDLASGRAEFQVTQSAPLQGRAQALRRELRGKTPTASKPDGYR
jgi:hypothetical protein